jgi:Zn-dependent peptidase ImmA (M78 family)
MTNKADYTRAQNEAQRVLSENYIDSVPVRVEELISLYGLSLVYADLPRTDDDKQIAGYINTERKMVFIHKSDTATRQAFTIAHELGHWLLHKTKLESNPSLGIMFRVPLGTIDNNPDEKEANCFAANLLVPFDQLVKYKDKDQTSIATLFGVSPDVIGLRLRHAKF